jgi:DUF4097 and DUF4098 domain-containing protein YvlB
MKKIFIFLVLWVLADALPAQTTLQVVTKNIRKSIEWKSGSTVFINSEKAEIEVTPGAGNTITVQAELSARHPDLDSARTDLEAWKLVVDASGGKVNIRAYIGLDAKAPLPTSSLKAKLRITVPAACPVNLSNKFGKAHLEKLNGPVALSGEFCSFDLVELGGKVELDSRYGNVEGRNLSGPISLQVKRADIELSDLKNSCSVKSEYGKVALEATRRTGAVTMTTNKSEVLVTTDGSTAHNFDVKTTYGALKVRKKLPFKITQPDKNTRQALLKRGEGLPTVKIVANFGQVELN